MEFNQNTPIYLQIAEALGEKILSGEWQEEARIPSVRELGVQLGVNPNTIVRVYDCLEKNGTIFNRRGIGFFVAPNAKEMIVKKHKKTFIKKKNSYYNPQNEAPWNKQGGVPGDYGEC